MWRQIQFARANALGAYKAKSMKDIVAVRLSDSWQQ
jgi:hypothetical protein